MGSLKGSLDGGKALPAIVASRFNEPIVEKLVQGATQGFLDHGVHEENINVIWVPGAFEIPLVVRALTNSRKYNCVVCVGCVLKGETYHFEYVAQSVASGIARIALESGIPVIFSVLLSESPQDAWERAGGSKGNRGIDGALAAIEMVNLLHGLKQASRKPTRFPK